MVDDKDKKAPLNNPEIDVRAEPDWDNDFDSDWDYLEKVAENVKEGVQKAIDDSEGDGAGSQIGAANDAVDDASRRVDPDKVDTIHVYIDDDDGRHIEIKREASGEER